MTMALADKKANTKFPLRPRVTQSHRGRLVRNLIVTVVIVAFAFMLFSNSLNPEEDQELSVEEEQKMEFEQMNNINKEPAVVAAPANPFEMLRVATLPSGFKGSPSYSNLIASAEGTAQQISTYSSKQTAEEYVKSVKGVDDTLRGDLLKSSKAMWPEITKADLSVKGKSAGIDPVIREYNEEATLATVEVVVEQTISRPDGTSMTQTQSYIMNLVGVEQESEDIAWTVGGFQKQ